MFSVHTFKANNIKLRSFFSCFLMIFFISNLKNMAIGVHGRCNCLENILKDIVRQQAMYITVKKKEVRRSKALPLSLEGGFYQAFSPKCGI